MTGPAARGWRRGLRSVVWAVGIPSGRSGPMRARFYRLQTSPSPGRRPASYLAPRTPPSLQPGGPDL